MRKQKGQIIKKDRSWHLRRYERVLGPDGKPILKRICSKLADYDDDHRSKKSVRPLAEEILAPLNEGKLRPESTMAVAQFIEQVYLPYVAEQKRPSTYKCYNDIWEDHVKVRIGETRLRDFRPADGTRLLAEIARCRKPSLSRRTLYHVKSFVSGVFSHAISQGWLDSDNPMRNAKIPANTKGPSDTYAYTLEEVNAMLALEELPPLAKTVLAVAAFTGLRKGEIRGLQWQDYNGSELHVLRSVWKRHVTEPKTERSKAPVPVIPRLAKLLDAHRGSLQSGPIFRASNGQPLSLDNLFRRVIAPVFAVNQITWHGWHAFRRSLATNLSQLDVDAKTIQGILRHSSLATTTNIYIKAVQADAVEAMRRLDARLDEFRASSKLPN